MQMDQATFLPFYAPDPRLRKRSSLASADAACSVGRRRCWCTASAIRRWRRRCTSGLIRRRRCWSRSCCHHYRAVSVCGNDGLQTHRRHEDDHDEQHDREFPGHCASGDGHTPGDTLPLTTGKSSHPRYGGVPYRYTPFRPSPSPSFRCLEKQAVRHRTVSLDGGTGWVNGTAVLKVLVLAEVCVHDLASSPRAYLAAYRARRAAKPRRTVRCF